LPIQSVPFPSTSSACVTGCCQLQPTSSTTKNCYALCSKRSSVASLLMSLLKLLPRMIRKKTWHNRASARKIKKTRRRRMLKTRFCAMNVQISKLITSAGQAQRRWQGRDRTSQGRSLSSSARGCWGGARVGAELPLQLPQQQALRCGHFSRTRGLRFWREQNVNVRSQRHNLWSRWHSHRYDINSNYQSETNLIE